MTADLTVKDQRRVPMWVLTLVAVIFAGLMVVGAVGVLLGRFRNSEEQQRCDRAIITRDDNRAMWEWAGEQIGQNPNASDFVASLRRQLDVRLPRLKCVSGVPVPIDDG